MAFLRKSHQRTQFTLYMLNYGSYIMSGSKTIDTNYNIQNRVSFYLNKDQIRLMDITRDVFEQRDMIEDGMSTSKFVKAMVLDAIPKFLKTISVEEMEKAEAAATKLAEARKELKVANRKKKKKGG